MPKRRQQLINNEIYHIIVRGISDKLIFKDIDDYYRGIFSIYEFNTLKPVTIRERREARARLKMEAGDAVSDNRDLLVETLAFCFMPTHIHLLLKQLKDGGITKFMNKFGAGYPAYFKEKYKLQGTGYFFQGRFTSVHVKTDEQVKTVFSYIHTNPASLVEPAWKEAGIKNPEETIEFLENYKWSSYPDYLNKNNFPSVTQRDFILNIFSSSKDCKEFVDNWIKYKSETGSLRAFYGG